MLCASVIFNMLCIVQFGVIQSCTITQIAQEEPWKSIWNVVAFCYGMNCFDVYHSAQWASFTQCFPGFLCLLEEYVRSSSFVPYHVQTTDLFVQKMWVIYNQT